MTVGKRADAVVLSFRGSLDAAGSGAIWRQTLREAKRARAVDLVFDLSGVGVCDTAGAAFLLAAEAAHGTAARFEGGAEHVGLVLDRVRAVRAAEPKQTAPVPDAHLLDILRGGLRSALSGIAFLGEAVVAIVRLPSRRRLWRWDDFMRVAEQAGFSALPLVLMMGYLIGLILSFQSLIPMRKFGADIYVVSLVAISLLRELGPLLSAVILSGRTGSAFAAEIGTMKVNEEIDALVTMGIDPMTMLVLPRLVAAVAIMPAITLALNLAGLAGMSTVMMGFGFPLVTIANQVQYWATTRDLLGGLAKAAVFGAVVAAIGCREGLSTGVGPRAVGESATGAVVGGIVSTILLDGLFAVTFYRLGL